MKYDQLSQQQKDNITEMSKMGDTIDFLITLFKKPDNTMSIMDIAETMASMAVRKFNRQVEENKIS